MAMLLRLLLLTLMMLLLNTIVVVVVVGTAFPVTSRSGGGGGCPVKAGPTAVAAAAAAPTAFASPPPSASASAFDFISSKPSYNYLLRHHHHRRRRRRRHRGHLHRPHRSLSTAAAAATTTNTYRGLRICTRSSSSFSSSSDDDHDHRTGEVSELGEAEAEGESRKEEESEEEEEELEFDFPSSVIRWMLQEDHHHHHHQKQKQKQKQKHDHLHQDDNESSSNNKTKTQKQHLVFRQLEETSSSSSSSSSSSYSFAAQCHLHHHLLFPRGSSSSSSNSTTDCSSSRSNDEDISSSSSRSSSVMSSEGRRRRRRPILLLVSQQMMEELDEEHEQQLEQQPLFLLHLIPSPRRSEEEDDDDDIGLLLPSNYKKRLTDLASRKLLKVQQRIIEDDRGVGGSSSDSYGGGRQTTTTTSKTSTTTITTTTNTKTATMTIPKVIHLHEDVWCSSRQPIVKSRLKMQMGLVKTTNRVYARKTVCRRIDASTAKPFLQQNHLWDYVKSKFHYGLFLNVKDKNKNRNKTGINNNDDGNDKDLLLVAVASFSHRRKVIRGSTAYNSFELLRYCCLLDHTVVGGISKLIKTFVKERRLQLLQQQQQQQEIVDGEVTEPVKIDIVTVIDRDWGGGDNWHSVGFETVQVLPPLCMAIGPLSSSSSSSVEMTAGRRPITQQRYHLVGAGIEHQQHNQQQQRQNENITCTETSVTSSNSGSNTTASSSVQTVVSSTAGRLGLPADIWTELDRIGNISSSTSSDIVQYLANHSYYPIYDSGVERLIKIVDDGESTKQTKKKMTKKQQQQDESSSSSSSTAKELWKQSTPTFAATYTSTNSGIQLLLKDAEQGLPPMDSDSELRSKESWRSSYTNRSKVVFSTPSSFDPSSTNVEVIERRRGWRTVGTSNNGVGASTTKKPRSIYHGFYKADHSGMPDPHAYVSEYIKTMAVVALALSQPPQELSSRMTNTETRQPPYQEQQQNQQQQKRFLHFGFGAGTLVRFLAYHGSPNYDSRHLAIELDEGVVKASNEIKLLSLPSSSGNGGSSRRNDNNTKIELRCGDALEYRNDDEPPFDCVCIDVFDDELVVPPTFYSTDFLEQLRDDILSDSSSSSCVIQNFHSGGKKRTKILDDATAAYRRVFNTCFVIKSLDSKIHAGNTILVGTNLEMEDGRTDLVERALQCQASYRLPFDAVARIQSAVYYRRNHKE